MNDNVQTNVDGLVDIGRFVMSFAQVNRVTRHPDGVRYESDTDHTVMLSVCACAVASKLYKNTLDIGLVAQFAIVHDLVEVYAQDVNTINIEQDKAEEKRALEEEAVEKIITRFESIYPWIGETVVRYERKDTKEARFVKTLDKAMTRITNILNKGATLRALGTSRADIVRHFEKQFTYYEGLCGEEFPELFCLIKSLNQLMLDEIDV